MPYDVLVQLQPRPKLHCCTLKRPSAYSVNSAPEVVKLNGYVIKQVALLRSTPHTCSTRCGNYGWYCICTKCKVWLTDIKKTNHLKVTPNWTFQMRNANFWAWKGETLRVRYIHSIPFYEPLSSMLWAQGGTMSRGAINRVRRIRDWAYSVRTGSRFAVLQYRSDLRYLSW